MLMKNIALLIGGLVLTGTVAAEEAANSDKPVVISCPVPVMPVKALALRISGSVNYTAWVNAKGEVYSISTTGDEIFFKTTQSAIKKCRYEPGKPGVVRKTVTFKVN